MLCSELQLLDRTRTARSATDGCPICPVLPKVVRFYLVAWAGCFEDTHVLSTYIVFVEHQVHNLERISQT